MMGGGGGEEAMAANRVLRWSRTRTWLCYSDRTCSSDYAVGKPSHQMQLHYFKRLNLLRNAFGIAFDIDGILKRGNETVGRAPDALRRLYKDVEKVGKLLGIGLWNARQILSATVSTSCTSRKSRLCGWLGVTLVVIASIIIYCFWMSILQLDRL